jgi:electron transport complex protein RnfA
MSLEAFFLVLISVVLVNNVVLSKFLGLCPYIGVSKDSQSAMGMGLAVIFVMTMASVVSWAIYHFFLFPSTSNLLYIVFGGDLAQYDLTYLRTLAFILVIATLVQFVEMVIQKVSPGLYSALGIYLPLITTNCAVLGVALLNIDGLTINGVELGYGHPGSFLFAIVHGFGAGIGFAIALLLMAGIRERLELADVPRPLRGMPIAFITAGLMAIAFMGFIGLVK